MNTLGELLRDRITGARSESLTRHTLPAQAIIVDSAPGGEALRGLITAFSLPLPKWRKPLRAISVTFFWSILKLYKAIVRPRPMFVEKIRAQLIDPSILPKGMCSIFGLALLLMTRLDRCQAAIHIFENRRNHHAGGYRESYRSS
jgi:hypothetical protein